MRNPTIPIGLLFLALFTSCHSKKGLGLNEEASFTLWSELPENPLLLHPITSSFRPNDSSMVLLLGNTVAFKHASVRTNNQYPEGSVLYEITWQLQADEQWFGARIPKYVRTVERVEIFKAKTPEYKVYHVSQMPESPQTDKNERIAFMLGQTISEHPPSF